MDLSAVAGSPAYIALQTLAAPPASAGAASSTDTSAVSTAAPETARVGAGANLYALSQGLGQALSAADAASSAGQTVLGLLTRMQQAAAQASGGDLSTPDRAVLDQSFQASAAAVAPALQAATVGGVNLADGSLAPGLNVALGEGVRTGLGALDLRTDGPTLGLGDATLSTPEDAATAAVKVDAAIQGASTAVAALQAQAGALATHASLVHSFGQTAASPLVDDAGDGARLLALQVSQQLSAQGGAIANAAPQQVLALFRG